MRATIVIHRLILSLIMLLILIGNSFALDLNNLFEPKEVDENERKETIERIEGIQDKLQLLQEKLRVLERRKAAKKAAERAAIAGEAKLAGPAQVNWLPIDETVDNPGDFGIYTYLLYQGTIEDTESIGALEDFILTIETLPKNDLPESLANRFLIPVEKPQSSVNLGRQPYDFRLNQAYLSRLGLKADMASGPILVSLSQPLDPYGITEAPPFLAVSLGYQGAQKSLKLAKAWHSREKDAMISDERAVKELFWKLIDGAGPVKVERNGDRMVVELQ